MECIQSRTLMLVIIAVTDKITVLIKSNITAGTKLIRFSLANTGLPCIEIRSYLEWCVSQKYILWTITRRLLRTIYGYDRIYFMIGRNRAPYNGTPSLIFLLPSPHHFDRIPFLTFVTEHQSSVCCLNYDTYHSYLRSSEPDAGNIEWNRQMPGGHLDNRQVRFVHKVDED